jgi:hypothetical protein
MGFAPLSLVAISAQVFSTRVDSAFSGSDSLELVAAAGRALSRLLHSARHRPLRWARRLWFGFNYGKNLVTGS